MTHREGRLRVVGPQGRCVIWYRMGEATVSVRAGTVPAGCAVALQFRGRAPAVFRCAVRQGERGGEHALAYSWALRPAGDGEGPASIEWVLDELLAEIGAGRDAQPVHARTRARIQARRFLRLLGRELLARCDKRARELALTFRGDIRFWVYQRINEDPSGRVAQMASTCPGLLLAAQGLDAVPPRSPPRGRDLLAGIRDGVRLGRLLSAAAELTLAPDVLAFWELEITTRRIRWATPEERAAAIAARRLLIRKAGPLVSTSDLFQVPPARIAAEDIPVHPVRNARWYRTMRRAQYVIVQLWEVDLREQLSTFASAHAAYLAGRVRGATPDPLDPYDVSGPRMLYLMQTLVRFLRTTGRRPIRSTNPRRLLAECEAWARTHDEDRPDVRLASFLQRVPSLGLGEVTAVTALCVPRDWGVLGRVKLPRPPAAPALVAGLDVRPLETPEAIMEEGARMRHCVRTWLTRVMEGNTWIYAVRAGAIPITVAVERGDHPGQYRIADARRADDELPTGHQRSLLGEWVERMSEGQQESNDDLERSAI